MGTGTQEEELGWGPRNLSPVWRKGAQQERRSRGPRGDREAGDTHAQLQIPQGEPHGPALGLQGVSSGVVRPHPGAVLQAETGAPDKTPIKSCCSYFM